MKYILTVFGAFLIIICLICLFGATRELFGQNTGALLPDVIPVYPNLSGSSPAANGFLCTQGSGVTTLLATYQEPSLMTVNQNPIRLNAAGRPVNGTAEVSVFMLPQAYRITLYAATTGGGTPNCVTGANMGSLIRQVDHVYDWASVNNALIAPGGLTAGRIPYTTGAHSLADSANLTWNNGSAAMAVNGTINGYTLLNPAINPYNPTSGGLSGHTIAVTDNYLGFTGPGFVWDSPQWDARIGSAQRAQWIMQSSSLEVAGQVSTALTAGALSGAGTITVGTPGAVNQTVMVLLNSGIGHITYVTNVVGSVVSLAATLPSAAGIGNRVEFSNATTLASPAAMGATSITVVNSVNFTMGDIIRVFDNGGSGNLKNVTTVVGNVIGLSSGLNNAASAGNRVLRGIMDVSPDVIISRKGTSFTTGDYLGNIAFTGPSGSAANAVDTNYGQIYMKVVDGSTIESLMDFQTKVGGSFFSALTLGEGAYTAGFFHAGPGVSEPLGFAPTSSSTKLILSNNASFTEPSVAGLTPLIHLISADTSAETTLWDSFGTNNSILLRRANGTLGSPTQALTADDLGHIGGAGYATTTGYVGARSVVTFKALEDWTASNQGAGVWIYTTPVTTTTPGLAMQIEKGVIIDAAGTLLDKGTGTLNVKTGLYVNDQLVATDIVVNTTQVNWQGEAGQFDSIGSGAPSNPCLAGSTYRNSAGGTGTSFYVCETNAWVGK